MKLLLHICCAPCSVSVIDDLKKDNVDVTGYWYNPNIHPYIEYKNRMECLKDYSKEIDLEVIYNDFYGLKTFIPMVIDDLENRCVKCYKTRMEETAKCAKENNFDAFSTTLLISPYQNQELIKKIGDDLAKKYNVKFYYKDFKDLFRTGQNIARSKNLYMQKYCGCIFSEEERYLK